MAGGGVRGTPYGAVQELGEWAIELWPYVNGRALTQGLRIGDLDAPDAFDVIHYYFEDDLMPRSDSEIEAKDAVRKQLYALMYEQEYRYGRTKRDPSTQGSTPPPMPDLPPEEQPIKPFIPATPFEEFEAAGLDAPLGGM